MKRRSVILIGILAVLIMQMGCDHDCTGTVANIPGHEFTLSEDIEAGTFIADISVNTQVLYRPLAEKLARAGYVTAIINYASLLDGDDFVIEEFYEAFAYALYDLKAAIRFFRKDADTDNSYRIDTESTYPGIFDEVIDFISNTRK